MRMRMVAAVTATALLAMGGCRQKTDSTANIKAGLNRYFDAHPVCLFPSEKKFPAQADTNNETDTAGYDALVQQGLLTRSTAEKTKLLILSKQVNMYDLNDRGRAVWTADVQQPGYGNFCYGKRKVEQITSAPPADNVAPGATTNVNFTYTIGNVADWARAAIVQNAFPNVRTSLGAASNGAATMVLGTDSSWQVQAPGSGAADIVQ